MQQIIKGIVFDIGGVLAHDVWEGMLLNEEKGLAARCGLDNKQVHQVGRSYGNVRLSTSEKPK